VAAVLACLLFSPVVIWNMQHDWLSFTFQSQGRVTSGYSFSLPRFIGNLVILLTPTGLLSVVAILFYRRAILSGAQTGNGKPGGALDRSYFLLLWLTLFPAAVFAALSLFRASKLNWTGPVWLGLAPFMALLLLQKPDLSAPKLLYWCQRAWPATLLVLLLAYGGALHYLGLGLPTVPYPQNVHLMGWQDFGRDIELLVTRLERETGEKILVVGMDRNKTASELAFYRAKYINSLDRKPGRDPSLETAGEHLFGGGSLMYELWFPAEDQNGKTMLLVGEKRDDLSSDRVLSRATVAQEVKEIRIWRNGRQTGQYYYRLIKGYQSQPVGKQPQQP
jgi:dolichol-phosphate mannosyltransferase